MDPTVDGRNPANQLVDSFSPYLQGFLHPRWLFGISSINSIIRFPLHPRNLTWNLKIMVSKWTFLFQGLIFGFHVKFRGCKTNRGSPWWRKLLPSFAWSWAREANARRRRKGHNPTGTRHHSSLRPWTNSDRILRGEGGDSPNLP